MMSADEVAQELNCSKSHAYKLVKAMNKELSAQGYITMAGRINKTYYRTGMQDIITEPKTKQSFRTIEIPEFLKEEIKEFVDGHYGMPDTERLFPVVQEAVQHKMKRQIELAGVKKIRVHDIRHSHVAYLIEKGVEPLLIRDRLGHKDIRITLNTYGHLYPNQQRKIANLLDNENGNAVTGLGEERDEC